MIVDSAPGVAVDEKMPRKKTPRSGPPQSPFST
jgi:hypothetical protein